MWWAPSCSLNLTPDILWPDRYPFWHVSMKPLSTPGTNCFGTFVPIVSSTNSNTERVFDIINGKYWLIGKWLWQNSLLLLIDFKHKTLDFTPILCNNIYSRIIIKMKNSFIVMISWRLPYKENIKKNDEKYKSYEDLTISTNACFDVAAVVPWCRWPSRIVPRRRTAFCEDNQTRTATSSSLWNLYLKDLLFLPHE